MTYGDVDLNLLAQIVPAAADLTSGRLLGRVVSDDYGSPDRWQMADLVDAPDALSALAAAVAAARTAGQIHSTVRAWVAAATPRIVGVVPIPPAPPDPTPTPAPVPSGAVVWDDQDQTLDQGQTGHCFPPETRIRLADGSSKTIDAVDLLDDIVTAEGRVGRVTQKMVRRYEGDLLAVRLRGHSGVRCTPEHPFLTRRGYVPASALQIGDSVALTRASTRTPSATTVVFGDIVALREYRTRGDVTRTWRLGGVETVVTAPPEKIALTPEFGRLCGLYAAEGHAAKRVATWCFGRHEAETLVPETVDLIRRTLGATARIQHRPNNVTLVVLGGAHWALLFERLLGKGAGSKRLHPALDGDDDFRRALLDGWIDGDGYRRRGTTQGVTISKALALDMHAIANDLGLRPTFNATTPAPNAAARTRQVRYDVAWAANEDRTDGMPTARVVLDDAATWRKVTAIAAEDFAGYVYNLEVEGDHSYVADGVGVHNCVGGGWADWGNTLPVDDHYTAADMHAIYYECKVIDDEPGGENGTSVHSGAKAMKARGRIAGYAWADNVQAIAAWITAKGPVVLGTDWFDGMFTPDANGLVVPTGNVAGGHCYLALGWDPTTRLFECLNSWGPSWSKNGHFWIKDTDLQGLLDTQGEACVGLEVPR